MNSLSFFLMASPQGGDGGGLGGFASMIPFVLIIVVMYFFMIRPQAKKAKDQNIFRESLDKGEKIVTIGGIHGRILEVRDTTLVVEVGNGVKLEVEKSAVSMELTKAVQKSSQATDKK